MHFMLISDNHDTLVGMRLAGIEGCIASTPDEVRKALNEYSADPSTGIILITEVLSKMCESKSIISSCIRQSLLSLLFPTGTLTGVTAIRSCAMYARQ